MITIENGEYKYFEIYLPLFNKWHKKDEDEITIAETKIFKEPCEIIIKYIFANHPDSLTPTQIDQFCSDYLESRNYTDISKKPCVLHPKVLSYGVYVNWVNAN